MGRTAHTDHVGVATPFYPHDGDGRLLFGKRGERARDERGRWDPGSGQLEPGRSLEANVKAEVREELGADCIVEEHLPPHSAFPEQEGERSHWLVVPFFVRVQPAAVELGEPEKITQVEWRRLGDFPEPLHSGFAETFQRFRGHFEEKLAGRTVTSLKFYEPLPEQILAGEKRTTWRIGDEKGIERGDRLRLLDADDGNAEFARADVVWVKHTTFGALTDEDRRGHESYASEAEMYETYGDYYDIDVGPDTPLKVVRFALD